MDIDSPHRLGRIAAELLRAGGVRLYHDQSLYKEHGFECRAFELGDVRFHLGWPSTRRAPMSTAGHVR
jgi:hypothetical protein